MSQLIDSLSIKAATSKEISRLKKEIEASEREINTLKYILGNKVFEEWKSEGVLQESEEIKNACVSIQTKLDLIESTREQITDTESDMELRLGALQVQSDMSQQKNTAVCPSCGGVNVSTAKFCRDCGAKM